MFVEIGLDLSIQEHNLCLLIIHFHSTNIYTNIFSQRDIVNTFTGKHLI